MCGVDGQLLCSRSKDCAGHQRKVAVGYTERASQRFQVSLHGALYKSRAVCLWLRGPISLTD